MTAAALAAILDPGKVFSNWWEWDRKGDSINESSVRYIGPDDLHTAREHAWRGEDWLEARGYSVRRTAGYTAVYTQGYPFFDAPFNMSHQNHAAAIAEAVRRIANG